MVLFTIQLLAMVYDEHISLQLKIDKRLQVITHN